MPCLKAPPLPIPALPLPFSIPALPAPPAFNLALCCKTPPIKQIPPLPKLPPVPPAVVAAIRSGVKVLLKYCDARPLKCPRE